MSELNTILKIFEKVSCDVIRQITGLNAKVYDDFPKPYPEPKYLLSIIIKVTGTYNGAISMTLKNETAIRIARAMMGNIPLRKLDEMAESAIKELFNIIIGQAMSELQEFGDMDISVPSFYVGKNITLTIKGEKIKNYIPISLSGGIVLFNIGLSK